jgi:hypothetical protein
VGKYAASLGGHPFATSAVRSNRLVCSGLADHPKWVVFFILPFVHCGAGWLRRSGVFESAMKTEPRPKGEAIYATR